MNETKFTPAIAKEIAIIAMSAYSSKNSHFTVDEWFKCCELGRTNSQIKLIIKGK